ncbi:MAG TPA: hypothetical protein VGR61_09870, partial [Candidatus Dormibacteraeota bacterium]|nr:hypothetical protein [Candidatus Dormibacteraeota bacterium]
GEAVVGGVSKWLIAGGIVGVAVLVFVVFGLASGLVGGHDKICVAVATPSPSASPSPSPSDSPSPSPGPSPSPSPSPTPIPTPSPSPSPVRTLLTLSNLNIYYETCTSRQDSTCSGRPVSGSACYSSANPCNLSDSSRNLKVMEAFDYAYASGSSRPITVTITWTANAGPTIDPTTYSYAVTLQPTGTHGPAQGVNYQALVGARPITNSATFSIQYTDDAGSHPIKRGPTFYWN